MVQRRLVLAAAAAASLCGCSTPPARAAAGQLVDVQLIDRARQHALPEYRHRGATWVAGRPGERYAVRLTNRSGARVLVVLSVDGVNAISGQTAGTSQSGYVLSPWQSADITGWRKNDDEAAAFYFTALPDSYAARTGRPDDVGVIGVALFRRKPAQPVAPIAPEPAARSHSDAASGARAAAERESRLGTGHGRQETSYATHVTFERATSTPAEVITLYYDSHANLLARGVIREPTQVAPAVAPAPRPFPGFVPDPRG